MEGKNESKHTPEDKVAIRVPNIRIPAGYSRDISAAILDYQSECNAILKEQTKRIKELEGRIRVETLLFEQLSETKKELDELRAEVDRLTKEQDMQQKALDWDRYKKHLAEQKVQTLESEAIRLRERHNKHGIAYSKLKTENDRLTKEKSEAIEALKAFVIDIEGHPSYAAREHYKPIMDKAKDLLTRIK